MLTTQYLEEADRLAHRIGVLDQGRIVAEGTPEELKSTLGTERVRLEFASATALDDARRVLPEAVADPVLLTLTADTDGTPKALAAVLAAVDRHRLVVRRVETLRPSLDDVFLTLTERRPVAA